MVDLGGDARLGEVGDEPAPVERSEYRHELLGFGIRQRALPCWLVVDRPFEPSSGEFTEVAQRSCFRPVPRVPPGSRR